MAQETEIGDFRCVLARPSVAGQPDWQIHIPPDRAPGLFSQLMGGEAAPTLVGATAIAVMQKSSGMQPITGSDTPLAAGLLDLCASDKEFIGSLAVAHLRDGVDG